MLQDFDQLWDYSNPSATEEKFRALLSSPDQSQEYRLCLQTQIARALGLQKRFEEAHALLSQIEAAPLSPLSQVRLFLERGRVTRSSGDKAGSKPFFLQALSAAQQHSLDFFAIDALHMLGILEPNEDWNQRAIHLAEQSAEPSARRWLGSLYNNVGWDLHDKGQWKEALDIFQKAVAFRQESNQPKELHVAHWCVGRTLRSLERYEEALTLQNQLLNKLQERNEEDGFVHEEIAECLLAAGRPRESKEHFQKAHQLLSQENWIEPERIQRLLTHSQPPIEDEDL